MSGTSKKVLLMGRAGAGKTSMRSIIFANYLARDTKRLALTNTVDHSRLRFLGNLSLSLWDCGGQDTFMENYFESQREHIFKNVEVLIYVMEVRGPTIQAFQSTLRPRDLEKDLQYFKTTCESIKTFSPQAKVICLVHKLDFVKEADRESVVAYYENEMNERSQSLHIVVYGTSIWDETLFKAWSDIVYSLVPNARELETHLQYFCQVTEADEVVLFDKSTFLVISRATRREHKDKHRFEKISNICKQFKLTCYKSQSNFSSLTVHNPSLSAFVERFTPDTYILLVVSDPEIEPAATLCNIDFARDHFEKVAMKMGLRTDKRQAGGA